MQTKPVNFSPFLRALSCAFVAAFAAPHAAHAQTAPQTPAAPTRPELVPVPYGATETPDYAGAAWEPASPFNFQAHDPNALPRTVNCIVIHDIEGSAISAVRWFQNKAATASSHYVIGADGKVFQMVRERDVAWHAGNRDINTRSVGIEHDGFAYRPGFYNANEYQASARLVRSIALRYDIPRDRVHIFGHAEVPDPSDPTKFGGRSNHTDPGPYWDWDTFMALVRNDAALAAPATLAASIKLRPGEKGQIVFPLTNTGDDSWPADTVNPRPDPALRQSGPVYLGFADPDENAPLLPGWISPQFAASGSGEAAPAQTAQFTVPFTGASTAARTDAYSLRLWKVFPAPRPAAAFGPTVSATVFTVPWDITAPLPDTAPEGWSQKTLPETQETIFWRKTISNKTAEKPGVVSWNVPLPIAGAWDVYVRVPNGLSKSARRALPAYAVSGPNKNVQIATPITSGLQADVPTGEEWQKLGRFAFDVPPPDLAAPTGGVRPGAKRPDPPTVRGIVSLLPNAKQGSAGGILTASEIRFIGPFAPVSNAGR